MDGSMRRFALLVVVGLVQSACVTLVPTDDDPGLGGTAGMPGAGSGGAAGLSSGAGGVGTSATGGTLAGGAGGSAPSGGVGGTLAGTSGGAGASGLGGAGTSGTGGGPGGSAGNAGTASAGMSGAAAGGTSGRGGAGASGSGGKGGTGGAGAFDPCPATGACKVLPLGDSITDGLTVAGGYRIELFHLALAADKELTYVGGSQNGPTMVDGVPFPRAHEGHSGWTISQIDGIVPAPALGVNPHIVLLHIGTNDMNSATAGAPDRLGALIDQIITTLPNALLVVSNIIPFPGRASAVTTYNAAVPGVVRTRSDAGKHILFVDQFTGFPTAELADGVHPSSAGYARMARAWFAAISPCLH
jgi:GDSL-like lipase/acylhydrolase family protein